MGKGNFKQNQLIINKRPAFVTVGYELNIFTKRLL